MHKLADELGISREKVTQDENGNIKVEDYNGYTETITTDENGNTNTNTGGTAIEGATGATLEKTNITATDTGYYYCIVTQDSGNETNTVTSAPIKVDVKIPVAIDTQPSAAQTTVGGNIELSVQARGSGTLSYQWYKNSIESNEGGQLIEGATNSTYTKEDARVADDGYYYCEIRQVFEPDNTDTTIKTNAVRITVNKANITPTVSMQGYTYGGEKATPTVNGNTENGEVTFYYNTTNSNENGTEWSTVTDSTSLNAGTYYMYAQVAQTTNYNGATTPAVEFTIAKATPSVTLSPTSGAVNHNSSNTFTATPNSASSINGTWQVTSGTPANVEITKINNSTDLSNPIATNNTASEIEYNAIGATTTPVVITVLFIPSDTLNYSTAEATYTVNSINKIPSTAPVLGNTTSTYNGQPHTVEITSVGSGGTIQYRASIDGGVSYGAWQADPPTITNYADATDGTIYVQAYVVGDGNHIDSEIVTATAHVSVVAMTISGAIDCTETYDGQAHGINISVSTPATGAVVYYSETVLTAENYTLGSTTPIIATNVSESTTVYWYIKSNNANYADLIGSNDITINKANVTLQDIPIGLQYVGKDMSKTFTVTSSVPGTWETTTGDANISITGGASVSNNTNATVEYTGVTASANATTITVAFTPTDTTNYNTPTSPTFTVKATECTASPATIELTADGDAGTITLGGTNAGAFTILQPGVDPSNAQNNDFAQSYTDTNGSFTASISGTTLTITPGSTATSSPVTLTIKEGYGDKTATVSVTVIPGAEVIYTQGQLVKYKNDTFHALYDVGSDDATMDIFAIYNLNSTGTAQVNDTYSNYKCAFSSSQYWSSTNLNINNIPGGDTDVRYCVPRIKKYALDKGAINGRLLTYEEANAIASGTNDDAKNMLWGRQNTNQSNSSGLGYLNCWLGSSNSIFEERVWYVGGSSSYLYYDDYSGYNYRGSPGFNSLNI